MSEYQDLNLERETMLGTVLIVMLILALWGGNAKVVTQPPMGLRPVGRGGSGSFRRCDSCAYRTNLEFVPVVLAANTKVTADVSRSTFI